MQSADEKAAYTGVRREAPIAEVENAALTRRDMLSFISAAVDHDGLVGHNIRGYNDLVENGIPHIMTKLFDIDRNLRQERAQTEQDRKRKAFRVRLQFHDPHIAKPSSPTYITGQYTDLWPGRARLTGLPYSGAVTPGATVTVTAQYDDGHVEDKTASIPPFQIGSFPIMVGSKRCHRADCSREGLKEMGEDPTDRGGYFIAKRQEYVVDLGENIRYNSAHIHKAMKANEHVRVEFLSQPGGAFENSSQIRIRYMTNGQITVEINSTQFEKARLPFFLLYRLFGMTSDRAVAETIVFDIEDSGATTAHILEILSKAFQLTDAAFTELIPVIDREKLVQMTAERLAKYITSTAYLANENAVQHLNETLLGSPDRPGGLDKILLPHMGQTAESRIRKLRFLGLLVHKLFLVHLGVMPPTDRDSLRSKRAHGAGVSLAKVLKTQVNNNVVIPVFRALKRELKNNPWESITPKTLIDTVRNALLTSDLNRAMEQAITSGNKTIVVRHRAAINRLSSQVLERKNGLNSISALRTVVTQNAGNASKQTTRADMMRRAHPTYPGFICVAQSADSGENVGMRKQLAITASVCTAGEVPPLKARLLANPLVEHLDDVTSVEMHRRGLARVSVNGELIGFCADSHALVRHYRGLRRAGLELEPSTTVCWDPVTDEVEFWVDVGRLRRPLLIVYNNVEEYDAALRARHAWAQAKGVPLETLGGSRPFRGVVLEDENDGVRRPRGLYYADGDSYVEFTPAWHELGRDAFGYVHNTPDTLIEGGLAVVKTIPDIMRNELHRLQETFKTGRTGGAADVAGDTPPPRVEFVQNTRFTPEHVRAIIEGRLTLGDLIEQGVAEYITPEEQENSLLAKSIDILFQNRHDVTTQYTHCDIEQAIFGLAAHVSPYGDHTQPARVTYETNQGRQTGGWYALNFPYRTDKNRFFQFYNEIPLVRTLAHKLVPANGVNIAIAYTSYTGDNQEDSAIINQASSDRTMFGGVLFRYELAELEKGESFCNPPQLTTKNLKPNASYEKLVEGLIAPGSVVRYGDVLVGRVAKLGRGKAAQEERAAGGMTYLYTDRSIVYRLQEPAYVEDVLRLRGGNDELFVVVKLRFDRPLRTGDKLSSRSGNKCLTPDHDVLTNRGWIPIAEVTRDDMVTCCVDNAMTDCRPSVLHAYDYQGPMVHAYGQGVDMCVTPNHRMWTRMDESEKFRFHEAGTLIGKYTHYANICAMNGEPAYSVPRGWLKAYHTEWHYEGKVHCLTVPGGMFLARRHGTDKPVWTGNSICALMMQQSDMPFTESGLTPDAIINIHSLPTRMTVGQWIETEQTKINARKGIITDGTAFLPVDHDAIAQDLVDCGFRYNGRERMYNGMTGECFDASIYIGFTHEQRLQKFVLDDEQAVAGSGPTDATTGQPLGGKSHQGGLRSGEMEQWGLESHGAMINLFEKCSTDSDHRKAYICRGCAQFAVYNEYQNIYSCRTCGELADISTVDSCKSAILFHEEIAAGNIRIRMGLKPYDIEEKRMPTL